MSPIPVVGVPIRNPLGQNGPTVEKYMRQSRVEELWRVDTTDSYHSKQIIGKTGRVKKTILWKTLEVLKFRENIRHVQGHLRSGSRISVANDEDYFLPSLIVNVGLSGNHLQVEHHTPLWPFIPSKGLVTNYGEGGWGYKTGGVGAREVLPLWKGGGGGGKSFSHAEGGGGAHNKFWGSFCPVAWCFSHIVGGARKVSTF